MLAECILAKSLGPISPMVEDTIHKVAVVVHNCLPYFTANEETFKRLVAAKQYTQSVNAIIILLEVGTVDKERVMVDIAVGAVNTATITAKSSLARFPVKFLSLENLLVKLEYYTTPNCLALHGLINTILLSLSNQKNYYFRIIVIF